MSPVIFSQAFIGNLSPLVTGRGRCWGNLLKEIFEKKKVRVGRRNILLEHQSSTLIPLVQTNFVNVFKISFYLPQNETQRHKTWHGYNNIRLMCLPSLIRIGTVYILLRFFEKGWTFLPDSS